MKIFMTLLMVAGLVIVAISTFSKRITHTHHLQLFYALIALFGIMVFANWEKHETLSLFMGAVLLAATVFITIYYFNTPPEIRSRTQADDENQSEPQEVAKQPTWEEWVFGIQRSTARFEHTFICAATGGGKTSLIKDIVSEDIETNAAIIVMAPKGDLIRSLAKLSAIDTDRLIFIEPKSYIPSFNIFDLGGDANQTVSLLNFMFNTTEKQGTLLRYCGRLLLLVPNATLRTLQELLREEKLPAKYNQYVAQLPEQGQTFFKEQFGKPGKDGYGETKTQLLWRCDPLLENPIIEKMFCQPETFLSIKDVMAAGKVLLIDTSTYDLGEEGSAFLGKFIIALVALATQKRETNRNLRPVYFYIDEVGHYLKGTSDHLQTLLDRAREARVGITLTTLNLRDLSEISPKVEASVLNTAIKWVGTCNDSDSRKLGAETGIGHELLRKQQPFNFHFSARGHFTHAVVDPALLDSFPQRTERELNQLIARNRERYASTSTVQASDPKPAEKVPQRGFDREKYRAGLERTHELLKDIPADLIERADIGVSKRGTHPGLINVPLYDKDTGDFICYAGVPRIQLPRATVTPLKKAS